MDGILDFPVTTAPATGGVREIAPGILWLRMPLPFALDHINLWLLEDGDGWTIVDTGYASSQAKAAWERIFAEHLGGKPVTRVVVTHFHPDHIGLADWLCRHWRAPLWTTEKEWLYARMLVGELGDDFAQQRRDFARHAGLDDASSLLFAERLGLYRTGVPSVPARYHRLADGMAVEIGGRAWQVVVGEGHAPELACLYCPSSGILISSDQVLPRISPNISVQVHEPDGNPLDLFLRSLERLRRIVPPETFVLPSHNLPFYGLHTRIEALSQHHAERCDILVAACAQPKSATELVPVLFRRVLDTHQMAFALGEALAHLHLLVARGSLVRERAADGVDHFRRRG